jgi:hypothetical protein
MSAELLAPFKQNITELEAALGTVELGYVCAWPKYGLAVALKEGKASVVGTLKATIFPFKKQAEAQTFTNGAGERAEVMSVYDARVAALDLARADLKRFEGILAAA